MELILRANKNEISKQITYSWSRKKNIDENEKYHTEGKKKVSEFFGFFSVESNQLVDHQCIINLRFFIDMNIMHEFFFLSNFPSCYFIFCFALFLILLILIRS